MNIDKGVELFNEEFKSIMDEYDFPLNVIQEIIQ
jgi:hypothetical protein